MLKKFDESNEIAFRNREKSEIKRFFVPIFAKVLNNKMYLMLAPQFHHEFEEGDVAFVFEEDIESETFKLVTDNKLNSQFFDLYYSQRRNTNE